MTPVPSWKSEMSLFELFLIGNTSRIFLSFLETFAPDPGRSIPCQEEFTYSVTSQGSRLGMGHNIFNSVRLLRFMYYK
jgi:hypothetical protein